MVRTRLVLLMVCAAIGAAGPAAQTQAGQASGQTTAPPPAAASPLDDYKVGPRDVIRVEVPRDPATFPARSYAIEVDGTISFWPTESLRSVRVAGLTTREIEQVIRAGMKKDKLLDDATVVVSIVEFKSKTFFMMGEVAVPGQTVLQLLRVTLLQALAQAGGVTAQAGPEVIIRRHRDPSVIAPIDVRANSEDPAIETLTFNREDLNSGKAPDPTLQEGDTIIVPKARFVLVNGEVRTPKPVTWSEGLTIMQAITACGGATDHAALTRIYITRMNPKTKKFDKITKDIKLTTTLQADDVINVPKKYFG